MLVFRKLLLALLVVSAAAIYPADHWTYSTALTDTAAFDTFVSEALAAAPAWNEVVRVFAGNQDVVFADVNLSEADIRGNHNPGAGGWPTIRYFNAETGPEGAPYEKKTDMSMCDELGPGNPFMEDYVEEAGRTSLCNVSTGANCDEKSLGYLEKFKAKDAKDVKTQIQRLEGLRAGEMKADLKDWVKKRLKILRGLLAEAASKDEL